MLEKGERQALSLARSMGSPAKAIWQGQVFQQFCSQSDREQRKPSEAVKCLAASESQG